MSQNEQIIGITLSVEAIQAIGNYLVTKPFNEVVELVNALQQGQPVFAQPAEDTPPGE